MIRHAAQSFKNLVLTVLLMIGGVCALEIGLRVKRASSTAGLKPERANIQAAVSVPNRATYLNVSPKLRFSRIDPETGKAFTLRTNSDGLRNPEIEVPKPDQVFRILCLGDDTTFAGDLPESSSYCRILAEELQSQTSTRVEVLNAGCPGGSPSISAMLFRHRLIGLQPDVVIVHVDPSDLADEETLRRHLERTPDGYPLAAMHPATAGKTSLASQMDDEFLLVRTVRDGVRDVWVKGQAGADRTTPDSDPEGAISSLQAIRLALKGIQQLAATHSITVMVSTATEPRQIYRGQDTPSSKGNWPPAELIRICEELGLPLIDATYDLQDLVESGTGKSQRKASLTRDGHAIYAEVIADQILETFMGVQAQSTPAQVPADRVTASPVPLPE